MCTIGDIAHDPDDDTEPYDEEVDDRTLENEVRVYEAEDAGIGEFIHGGDYRVIPKNVNTVPMTFCNICFTYIETLYNQVLMTYFTTHQS